MHEVLRFATEVDALFAIQFQAMNKNTFNAMPPDIQKPFMAAAQEAADQANQMDRDGEGSFKKQLRDAKMEIYTPSAAEKQLWQKAGEELWESVGKSIDRAVIRDMTALR